MKAKSNGWQLNVIKKKKKLIINKWVDSLKTDILGRYLRKFLGILMKEQRNNWYDLF